MKIYEILLHKHSKFKKVLIKNLREVYKALYKADLNHTKYRENKNRSFSVMVFEKSVKKFHGQKK